jgi:hypothetical protein
LLGIHGCTSNPRRAQLNRRRPRSMGRVVRATPMEPAVERAVRICPSRGHSPGAARPPNAVRSAALGRGREPQTAEGLGRSRHQLSALGKRGCPTDSEFCWRGPQVHKPGVTKLTRHGVLPLLKRAQVERCS